MRKYKGKFMLPNKLCFVDLETTGGSLRYGRVIEVGILRIENNQLVDSYQTLVNPECFVEPQILELTGILPTELEKAPTFGSIYQKVREILDDAIFVAHNVRFDYSFLKQEFKRLEISFSPKHFCTVKLSKKLFPQFKKHNLDSIIERFNLSCHKRHRAFDDAEVLWNFYQKVQELFPEEILMEALNKALKKPSLPINLSPEILDNLPEAPGVYIFYGQNGMPLYVGKSINIKERVLSHFAADHSSPKEMNISQQIESIETITTAGELGALIKESFLVKKLQPLYNRKLRLSRKMVILKAQLDQDGYQNVILDDSGEISVSEIDQVLGVFRSKKQAKEFLIYQNKEHSLCEKLLGIEKTSAGCFSYRLGKCKGACLKKEESVRFNLRFTLAFAKNKLKKWPFAGPILIKEENLEDEMEGFLIDKWCYLGNVKSDDNLETLNSDYQFDLDTYKILNSYLKSPKNLKNIITSFSQGSR